MSLHRVTLTQLVLGQTVQNVIHLDNPDGAISDSGIADFIIAGWITRVRAIQGTQLNYVQIAVQNVATPNVAPFIKNIALNGQLGGFAITQPFLAIVYRFLTATAGRKGRGRVYFAGCNPQSIDATGLWSIEGPTNPFQVLAGFLFDNFVSVNGGASATGLQLMVASPPGAVDGPNPRLVNNIAVRATPGTQNKRKLGVGI